MENRMMKVFVYGTLIPGQRLYPGIEDQVENYSKAEIEGYDLFMAKSGWYPVVVPGEGTVKGYILDVKDEALATLDGIEGYPFLYDRVEVTTTDGDTAWVYVGSHARPDVPIPDGDFVSYVEATSLSS